MESMDYWGYSIILGVLGLIIVIFGIVVIIWKLKCRTEVEGVFIRFNAYHSKVITRYSPVFQYEFEGVKYERQALNSFKNENSSYVEGQKYIIFINEKKPTRLVAERKVQIGDIGLVLFGLMFLIGVFIYMFSNRSVIL